VSVRLRGVCTGSIRRILTINDQLMFLLFCHCLWLLVWRGVFDYCSSLACQNYFDYTEGPDRWDPINGGFGVNGTPACPDTGDCSSYATWIYWTVIGQNGGTSFDMV
jgi:hypothetical protein